MYFLSKYLLPDAANPQAMRLGVVKSILITILLLGLAVFAPPTLGVAGIVNNELVDAPTTIAIIQGHTEGVDPAIVKEIFSRFGLYDFVGKFAVLIILFAVVFKWGAKYQVNNYPGRSSFFGRFNSVGGFVVFFVAGFVLAYVVSLLTELFVGTRSLDNQRLVELMITNVPVVFGFLTTAILAPVIEELFFRHYLIGIVLRNTWLGVVASALVFGLGHTSGLNLQLVPYFLLGLLLASLYKVTRSIALVVLIHIVNNLLSYLITYFHLA